MLILQLAVYCLIFTVMVRLSVIGGAADGLYFYPKTVQDKAVELGITDRETIDRRFKRFMIIFYIVMAASLVLIVGLWSGISDFRTAYLRSLFFLEVMNWYDGIVIDKLWVGHSKFWVISGLEGMPYVQTWGQMVKKRLFLSLVWVAGAVLAAGIVVLIF